MGGPRTSVEAIRAKLGKGDIVTLVPDNAPAIELTAGEGNSGMYTDYLQTIPEARFTSLILLHEWIVNPNDDAATTFLLRVNDSQAKAKLKHRVAQLVNVPVFDAWTEFLWSAGRAASLIRPTHSAGGIDLLTVSLDAPRGHADYGRRRAASHPTPRNPLILPVFQSKRAACPAPAWTGGSFSIPRGALMTQTDQRRRVPHVCPDCGCVRRLKPSDAAKTKKCLRCHCQEIAPLGFAATAARKGRDFAIRAAARKRKQCPSSLEQRVEAALREIPGIAWEREYTVERPIAIPTLWISP